MVPSDLKKNEKTRNKCLKQASFISNLKYSTLSYISYIHMQCSHCVSLYYKTYIHFIGLYNVNVLYFNPWSDTTYVYLDICDQAFDCKVGTCVESDVIDLSRTLKECFLDLKQVNMPGCAILYNIQASFNHRIYNLGFIVWCRVIAFIAFPTTWHVICIMKSHSTV